MDRGGPWFKDPRIGTMFIIPVSWQGYACYAVLLGTLIGSIPFHGRGVMIVRIVVVVGFLALSFAKSYRE